jgi:hypothetical protein
MKGSVSKLINKIDICFLFEALHKSLLPLVDGSQMQNILAFGVGDAKIEAFILQYLCDVNLIFKVGINEGVAFERIVIVENKFISEWYFLYESADCFLVAFA